MDNLSCVCSHFEQIKSCTLICADACSDSYEWYALLSGDKHYTLKKYKKNINNGADILSSFEKHKSFPWFTKVFGGLINAKIDDDKNVYILQEYMGIPLCSLHKVITDENTKLKIICHILSSLSNLLTEIPIYTDCLNMDNLTFDNQKQEAFLHCACATAHINESRISSPFIPPETEKAKELGVDNKSVVYSLGILLLAFTFKPSFDYLNYISSVLKENKITKCFLSPNSCLSSESKLSQYLQSILTNMLQFDVEKRYSFQDIKAQISNMHSLPIATSLDTSKEFGESFIDFATLRSKYGAIKYIKCIAGKDIALIIEFEKQRVLVKKYIDSHEYTYIQELYHSLNTCSVQVKERVPMLLDCDDEKQVIISDYSGERLKSALKCYKDNKSKCICLMDVVDQILNVLKSGAIYHGDIKPSNIIIMGKYAKLLAIDTCIVNRDFNIEENYSDIKLHSCTLEYAPRELMECVERGYSKDITNHIYPRKIDIYCLGKTILSMLHSPLLSKTELIEFFYPMAETHNLKEIVTKYDIPENVFNYLKLNNKCEESNISICDFIDLLRAMTNENPNHRPSTDQIISRITSIQEFIEKEDVINQEIPLNSSKCELPKNMMIDALNTMYFICYQSPSSLPNYSNDVVPATIKPVNIQGQDINPLISLSVEIPYQTTLFHYLHDDASLALYMIGGVGKYGKATNKVTQFFKNSLITCHSMSEERVFLSVCAFKNFLYIGGGIKNLDQTDEASQTIEMYDTASDKFIAKQNMLQPRYSCCMCVVIRNEALLYILGGKIPDSAASSCGVINSEVYKISLDYSTLVEVYSIPDLKLSNKFELKIFNQTIISFSSGIAAQISPTQILIFAQNNLRLDSLEENGDPSIIPTSGVPLVAEIDKNGISLKYHKIWKDEKEKMLAFDTTSCICLQNKLYIIPKFNEISSDSLSLLMYDKQTHNFTNIY